MRQLKSVRNYVFGRFTLDQMIAGMVYLTLLTQLLDAAIRIGLTSYTGIVLEIAALILSGIYFKFFFKESTLYNSKAMIMYIFAAIIGETEINKYTDTTEFINKKIPVKKVHANGIIEFKNGGYGVLMTQVLPHLSPAQKAGHLVKIEDMVNALPIGILFKSMNFSSRSTEKPHLEQVRCAINDPNTTDEMRKHLYDSYDALSNVQGRIEWDGWAFAGIGNYKNAEDAYQRSLPAISAIMKSMDDASIITIRMTNEYEIIKVYRQMLSMKKVF